MKDGDWYWIPKAMIQKPGQDVGAIGIAVYNVLASMVDSNQTCFPSQGFIAKRLGYSRSYINETLKLLEKNRLIKIDKRGRYRRVYHLLKLSCQPDRTQVSTVANRDVVQGDTNDNKLTRIIKNIDIEDKNLLNVRAKGFENVGPLCREKLLALDLAQTLNDRGGLALYLSYAKRYPESFLRRVLGEVKEIPDRQIKKSRGALFNHLVQKYANETHNQ